MQYLSPSTLALPGTLAALSAATLGRPWLALSCAVLTLVIHPLYGVAAAGTVLIEGARAWTGNTPIARRRGHGMTSIVTAVVSGVAAILLWYRPQEFGRLDDADFFQIYAYFRTSHHLIPSEFPWQDWFLFTNFTICSALFIYAVRHRIEPALPLLWVGAGTMLGFGLGTSSWRLFRCVKPRSSCKMTPIYLHHHVDRVVLGGGAFGTLFEGGTNAAGSSTANHRGHLRYAAVDSERHLSRRRIASVTRVLAFPLALGFWAVHSSRRRLIVVSAMVVLLGAFATLRFGVFREQPVWLGHQLPTFTLDDFATAYDDVSSFARAHTERDDVFVYCGRDLPERSRRLSIPRRACALRRLRGLPLQ